MKNIPQSVEQFFRDNSPFVQKRMGQLLGEFQDVNGIEFNPNDPTHAKVMAYAIDRYKLLAVNAAFGSINDNA